ncbi:MAG TPA: DUF1186 domain-containing protein [Caldilineaceae bacterium]|nr:DUF1186 domain-containing protein [Caldilineaceae bacterium]
MTEETQEMTVAEVLAAFSERGPYRRDAVEAALAQPEAMIPELIGLLTQVRDDPDAFVEDPAPLYALFLLSHLKATAAHTVIADLLRLGEWAEYIFGDLITEEFSTFLYRTYDNDPEPVKALLADRTAGDFARAVGADVLVYAVAEGRLPREEVLSYLSTILTTEPRDDEWNDIFSLLVYRMSHLYPTEQMDLIRSLYEDELVDSMYVDLAYVEQIVNEQSPQEAIAQALREAQATATDELHDDLEEWVDDYSYEPELDLAHLLADSRATTNRKAAKKKAKSKRKMAKASRKKNRRKR